ncbi:hypothetical protein ACWCSD_31885 [Nonomuraea sp. NPDC001684]
MDKIDRYVVAAGSVAMAVLITVLPECSVAAKLAAAAYLTLLIVGVFVAVMVNVRKTDRRSRASLTPDQRRKADQGRR